MRVAIPKGSKRPVSPVLASVLVTSLKLLVENGKIGLARVIEDFDRGDVFDFLGVTPRELNAYVAEGKLHRASNEVRDHIYFRDELLALRRERLVEVAAGDESSGFKCLCVSWFGGLWWGCGGV